MSVIDNAVKHFDEQDVRVTLVPEWGQDNEPLKIYSKPLTLSVLIYKALDGEGAKLFDIGDKNKLLNSVDREVLVRVAQEIMGQVPIEETKKD